MIQEKPNQVDYGRAFEYSIAKCYYAFLLQKGLKVELIENTPLENAIRSYGKFPIEAQRKYDIAAKNTINTLVLIEPGLCTCKLM